MTFKPETIISRCEARIASLEERIQDEANNLSNWRISEAESLALTDVESAQLRALRHTVQMVEDFGKGISDCPWSVIVDHDRSAMN